MKYVVVGLAFGLSWAGIQYFNGAITEPAALAGPVLLFGIFGAVLWGVRALIVRLRKNTR